MMLKRWWLFLFALLFSVAAHATVVSQSVSVTYTCTGSVGPFAFVFSTSGANAISVTQNSVLLATSAYTVNPVNNNYDNGGSVTLNAACPASQPLVITRTTPLTQTSVFSNNMPTPQKTIENGLDKLTEIAQELGVHGGTGSGVSSVSVATANGFQGTVTNPNTTPSIAVNVDSTHVLPTNTGNGSTYLNSAGGYTVPTTGGANFTPTGVQYATSPTVATVATASQMFAAFGVQNANCFFAGPVSGSPAIPTCRAINPSTDITLYGLGFNTFGGASPGSEFFWNNASLTIDYHTVGAQQALTLTTTGSSGPATLSAGALNIPQYAGGGGTVTHTAGALTLNQYMLGNGGADSKVDPDAGTDGAGNQTVVSSTTTGNGSTPSGDSFVQNGIAPTVVTNAASEQAPAVVTTANTVQRLSAPCSGLWDLTNSSGIMASSCAALPLSLANMSQLFVDNPQTSTYNAVTADLLGCKTITVASGTFTIGLLSTVPASGQCLQVINYGTGTITVSPNGHNLNGSSSSATIPPGSASAATGGYFHSDGTNYEGVWSGNLAGTYCALAGCTMTGTLNGTMGIFSTAVTVGGQNVCQANGTNCLAGSLTGYRYANGAGSDTAATTIPAASIATGALANGMTATTQSAGDNSTKLATTAYVDALIRAHSDYANIQGALYANNTILGPVYLEPGPGVGGVIHLKALIARLSGTISCSVAPVANFADLGTSSSTVYSGISGTVAGITTGTSDGVYEFDGNVNMTAGHYYGFYFSGGTCVTAPTFDVTAQVQ